jgi:hypothetical protein
VRYSALLDKYLILNSALRHHGLPNSTLYVIFQSTVIVKLSSASPAWWGIQIRPTGLVWRPSFVGQLNSDTETSLPRCSQTSALWLMTNCFTIFYATPNTYYIHYFLHNTINITPFETAHTTYRFLSVPQHSITITFLFECYLKTCHTVVSPVYRCDNLFLLFTFSCLTAVCLLYY